ncbi:redoxin domain-containing protein [Anatilimnocola floriformis]|uniref:redoxin domain-containing protein n=1 Tax=Anatilimnocola floriformis TaxID=2948575 RepID=UPI0020C422C5|nr:redoxin domain-containing protein [Anatilimnocola floriformis]
MTTSNSTPAGGKRAGSSIKDAVLATVALIALAVVGWYLYQQLRPAPAYTFEVLEGPVESNQDNVTAAQLLDMPLVDEQGQPVSLRERQGKQHLVIVFTRGSMAAVPARSKGPQLPQLPNVCPYCSTQATGIANCMPEFIKEDAAVLLVFPVTELTQNVDAVTLRNTVKKPGEEPAFPILLDVKLQAVDKLGLRDHLARPASFIIDKSGDLRFAYVAKKGSADRPSGNELLRRVKQLNEEKQ